MFHIIDTASKCSTGPHNIIISSLQFYRKCKMSTRMKVETRVHKKIYMHLNDPTKSGYIRFHLFLQYSIVHQHEMVHQRLSDKKSGCRQKYLDNILRKLNDTNCWPEPSKTMGIPWQNCNLQVNEYFIVMHETVGKNNQ